MSVFSYRTEAKKYYGHFPRDWRVAKFSHVATIRNGQVDPKLAVQRSKPLIAPNHVESGTGRLLALESAEEQGAESGKYSVDAGDVVYSKIRPALRKVTVAPCQALCSADMYAVQPEPGVDGRFLSWLLLSEGFTNAVVLESMRVAMPKVNRDSLSRVPLVVPCLERQRAIADLLDRKTAAINALIEKKERLIALLQEKRQALVTRAVTKGLDPNVPMKDSGIQWIGSVPRHWEIRRTKFVCRVTTGGRDTQDAVPNGHFPFFVRSDTVERIDSYSFDGEGVLTSGDGAGVGKVFHHYAGKMEVHQRVYLYCAFKGVLGRFFYYFLREHLHRVALAGNAKSTVDSLRRPMLLDFPVPVPPVDEQRGVLDELDRYEKRHDALVAAHEKQLALLREYRQALITEAVTGKLDISSGEAA